ncbi:Ionotropic glutamate receptor [Corchorus olitorius]|uniref:Ionotropic glutamate receptor n=1 Tax=Corchorus olitorius TaxID=93759 RepID=A0A1R3J6Z4_9ROSI|nr:Ionotropic glutamate receptor [Corchorus olitorius]
MVGGSRLLHLFCLVMIIFSLIFLINIGVVVAQNTTTIPVKFGVVLDFDKMVGKIGLSCINMALSDFYSTHGSYRTRLVLNPRDSKMDVVGAAAAALDLIKNVEVQAIIGPHNSMQANFVINLGNKSHVPIITFSATSPSLTSLRSPYFIRATQNDSFQVHAISAIVQHFRWREAVPIYIDNEFGEGIIPYLTDALQMINARVPYRSVIPSSATNDQIIQELYKLMTMPTRVFIVHMTPSLGNRLFSIAKQIGMMSKGYAWIVTDGMTNVWRLTNPSTIDSFQGILGVRTLVPQSNALEDFRARWKRKFQQDNPTIIDAELNIFGLWAYDATVALAMAIENVSLANFIFNNTNSIPTNGTDLETFGVSLSGSQLIQALSGTQFKGLTGDIRFLNGQLQSSIFEIVNVNGNGERRVGFWTPKSGIVRELADLGTNNANHKPNLGPIIWPGDTTSSPKGWEIPTNGKKLRIGVPVKAGVNEDFRGPPLYQAGTSFWFSFSSMVFAHRERVVSNLARFVVIIWCFVVLILTQSYTASLASLLTVQQLQPTVTDINEILKKGERVGFLKGSFVEGILKDLKFSDSQLVKYESPEELNDLFVKGSANGGIAAALDEIPYIKLFLAKHCGKYTTMEPTFETDGFGFIKEGQLKMVILPKVDQHLRK